MKEILLKPVKEEWIQNDYQEDINCAYMLTIKKSNTRLTSFSAQHPSDLISENKLAKKVC